MFVFMTMPLMRTVGELPNDIVDWLCFLSALPWLDLENNRWEEPPHGIVGKGLVQVTQYFHDLYHGGGVHGALLSQSCPCWMRWGWKKQG
ncbi:unnamed protein product [Discosporangium mesarthrocarpum]